MGSVQSYYCSKQGEVSLVADKQQNANDFLKKLHGRFEQKVTAMVVPEGQTLQQVVARVIAGYEAKQGILLKIWECFLSLLQRWMPAQFFLSQAQELYYHAAELNKMDTSQTIFLPSSDPAANLKEFFCRFDTVKDPEWIAKQTPAEMISKVFSQAQPKGGIITNLVLMQTAACAVKTNHLAAAKEALNLFNQEEWEKMPSSVGECSESQLETYHSTGVFYDLVEAFLLQGNKAEAVEVLELQKNKGVGIGGFDKCMENCHKAGKDNLLLAAWEEKKDYDAIAEYCIKYKDRKRLLALGNNIPKHENVVTFLLEEAKTDKGAYQEAFDCGFGRLQILKQIVDSGCEPHDVALGCVASLHQVYCDPDPVYLSSVEQLGKYFMANHQYALAKTLVSHIPMGYVYLRSTNDGSLKPLIDEIYEYAMKSEHYSLAIVSAEKPMYVDFPETAYASEYGEALLETRKEAYKRLKVICKLVPIGSTELQNEADEAKERASQLLHDRYGFVEALS